MSDLATIARLRGSLQDAGRELYKLRAKSGALEPLVFNPSQVELHAQLEAQREQFGWVRALVLKGRQQGISTYVAARFYHRASMNRGTNVYILSHEQSASDTLFGIVDRYHRNNPIRPHVGVANVKELEFDRLDSSYAVATAGNKAGGRSKAISLFHGSEVAYWMNAPEHFGASVQGVPLIPGTEIILESTSAGAGGEFYERYTEAEAGRGDYIAVFLPWWLDPGYLREPPPGFTLSTEQPEEGEMSEQEYADTYKLPLTRMAWRRSKMQELRSLVIFKREYPAEPAEAWTAPPGHEPFITSLPVIRARKRTGDGAGPLILGVDPASNGGDRFSVASRRGRRVEWVRYRNKINHEEAVAWLKALIDELRPARVNIDAGNIGANIITSLKNMGPAYAEVVRGVNFGGTSQHKLATPNIPGPRNRRAEMWSRMRDWLDMPEGAILPDDSAIQTDMTAPKLKPQPDNTFLLESKVDMKRRNVRSPDFADAIALTFASNEFFKNYHQPAPVKRFGDIDTQAQALYDPPQPPVIYGSGGPGSWMI